MRTYNYLLMFTLALSGCASGEFVISPDFTPEQTELIVNAYDEWHFTNRMPEHVRIGERSSKYDLVLRPEVMINYDGHCCSPDIRLDPEINMQGFAGLALHEIGHWLGLEHVDDPNSIMWPYLGTKVTLSAADRMHYNASF